MNTIHVSIIIPVFNAEKTIRPCLDSICALRYPSDNELAQIIQTHIDNLTLLIVPGSKFNEIDKNRLIQELQNRVGKEMAITVDMRDCIETSANGKFKAVISMLDRN